MSEENSIVVTGKNAIVTAHYWIHIECRCGNRLEIKAPDGWQVRGLHWLNFRCTQCGSEWPTNEWFLQKEEKPNEQ